MQKKQCLRWQGRRMWRWRWYLRSSLGLQRPSQKLLQQGLSRMLE